jgi:hypothetical protein
MAACAALVCAAAAPLVVRAVDRIRAGAAKNQAATAQIVRARANWFFSRRATAQGHVPAALLAEAFASNARAIAEHKTYFDRLRLAEKSPAQMMPSATGWTPLGPQPTANTVFFGNVSGRVTSVVADPCDATGNTLYAGAADGGVWVSFNALGGSAVTWKPLTDSQASLAVGAIALVSTPCGTFAGHAQSSEIVVGTGESNFAGDNLYGAGVLRSIDGGSTWAQDSTFTQAAAQGPGASGPYIGKIAAQPGIANPVLLAAVQGTDYAAGGSLHSGIWRSTDGGASWTRSQPGAASATSAPFNVATDVLFDPNDPSGMTAFAALGDPNGDSDPAAACTSAPCNGVYVSIDAGATWSRLAHVDQAANPASFGRVSFSIAPPTPQLPEMMWLAIADASTNSQDLLTVAFGTPGFGGLFYSDYPTTPSGLPDFCAPLCFYSMQIDAVHTGAGTSVFVGGAALPQLAPNAYGTSSIYRTTDGGGSWADVSDDGSGNNTSTHTHVHSFSSLSDANGVTTAMYVGNDGGVWATTDAFKAVTDAGSQHWANLNSNTGAADTSLNITQFYPGMSVHPSSDQILYGGTQGNDAQQFTGTLAWADTLACPWDGGYTAIDSATPSTIYVACNYLAAGGTLNKNTDNGVPGNDGANWAAIDSGNGINFNDNASFIPPFVMDPSATSNLYFGTYRIYQSTNSGANWSAITGGLTSNNSKESVTAIAVAPSNSSTLFAGTSDGQIWKTSQALSGAGDIQRVNQNGQPGRTVSAIAVSPVNAQAVFAAYSGFSCAGTPGCDGLGHVFYSANGGSSWLEVDGDLPDVPVNDVVVDPADMTSNTVYLATDAGVYASANATAGAGTTWSVLEAGLPNVQVLSLKLRNVSRTLVAGTHGRGAWNLRLPGLPAFVLTGIDPVNVAAGAGTFTLTATGQGFTQKSAIVASGTSLNTTFVNATTLTASVVAANLACAGATSVTVNDPAAGNSNSLPLAVAGSCDFALAAPAPASATTTAGGTASYQFNVTQQGSAAPAVSLACTTPPAGITCAFSPNPVTPTTAGAAVTLTVNVPASAGAAPIAAPPSMDNKARTRIVVALLCGLAFLLLFGFGAGRKRTFVLTPVTAGVLLFVALCALAACGGGGGSTPPPGNKTYTLTITGSAGNLSHSTSVQLVVD